MINNFSLFDNRTSGDIELIKNGIGFTGSLWAMVYSRWFGGNKEASSLDKVADNEDRHYHWGNDLLLKDYPSKQFNSKLERFLQNNVLSSGTISRIERIAKDDLKYLEGIANIDVEAYIESPTRLKLIAKLTYPDNRENKQAEFIWDSTFSENSEHEPKRQDIGFKASYSTSQDVVLALYEWNNYLFAGTDATGNIYRKYYWRPWELVFETGEDSVIEFQEFEAYLYAGTGIQGELFRSVDGVTWENCYTFTGGSVFALEVFEGYLYAGFSGNNSIYRSDDGTTWAIAETFSDPIRSINIFDNQLYAGTYTNGLIYVSDDGLTWSQDYDSGEEQIRAMFEFKHYLYAGTSDSANIYRKPDSYIQQFVPQLNDPFNQLGTFTDGFAGIALDYNDNIYVNVENDGVYKSTDGGINFTRVFSFSGGDFRGLGVAQTGDIYTCAGTDGVFISRDNGSTFNIISGLINATDVTITNEGLVFICSSTGDIYFSDDNGYSFSIVYTSAIQWEFITSNSSGEIYVTRSFADIYKSTDNGISFTALSLPSEFRLAIKFDKDDSLYFSNPDFGIYRTDDEFVSKTLIYDNNVFTNYIGVSKINKDVFFTVSNDYIYKSIGTWWQQVYDGDEFNMFSFTEKDGYMYVGSNNGEIYRTKDGVNWELYDDIADAGGIIEILNYKGHLYTATGPDGQIFKEHNTQLIKG